MRAQRVVDGFRALIVALSVGALLGACASSHRPDPSPLESLPAGGKSLTRLWSQHISDISFPVQLNLNGGELTVPSDNGQIVTLNVDNGAVLSRLSTGARLATGVGSDGQNLAVVTAQNELLVYASGQLRWHTRLPSQVVSAPLVAGQRVFVLTVDRSVYALDALDGRKLWAFQRPSEPLALRQAGVLSAVGNLLWVGIGPRLLALDPTSGGLRQEVILATPRGSNEVERLADIVAPAARVPFHDQGADVLCVRAYQLAVGCVETRRAELMWANAQAGLVGLAADQHMVVGGDSGDRVAAWSLTQGQNLWRNEHLTYRSLTAPALLANGVVLGDAEGYLHVLDRDDGHTVGRAEACLSSAVISLRKVDDRVLALCGDGTLSAFSLQ